MYYKLIRDHSEGKAVRGTLYSVEHRYSGSIGIYREYLTPIAPTLENRDYLIPALIYKVSVTNSPKFHRPLPVLNAVPGRSGIRIHRGTKPEHSKGCILVSSDIESRLTNTLLQEQNHNEPSYLEIYEKQQTNPGTMVQNH